jgi:hypothetical protein
LVSAGKRKWEKFLHTQQLARAQTYQKRMKIFARAAGFVSGQALTRAKSRLALARVSMLRVLQSQIDSYRAQIEKLFAQHPDHDLFGSLPGAGPKIAPRLLGDGSQWFLCGREAEPLGHSIKTERDALEFVLNRESRKTGGQGGPAH